MFPKLLCDTDSELRKSAALFSMTTSSNGNIFRVTGPLWGESTGHRLIALTKASDTELLCFLWSAPVQNGWAYTRDTGDLRRHRAHYDVTVKLNGNVRSLMFLNAHSNAVTLPVSWNQVIKHLASVTTTCWKIGRWISSDSPHPPVSKPSSVNSSPLNKIKMADISQTIFSDVFPLMKMYDFRLRFHWNLFLRVQLTTFQHWFR